MKSLILVLFAVMLADRQYPVSTCILKEEMSGKAPKRAAVHCFKRLKGRKS